MRVAAGRRARSRALEGGVRERMSARGGTRRVCAGGTGRAVRVCACARCACPAVLKDTSGRRRRGRCPGDVTARPSDNRPVPEPSADTRGGSCGGGSGGGGAQARPASRSWSPQRGVPGRSAPGRPAAPGDLSRSCAASPRPPPRQRRAGSTGTAEEAGTGGLGAAGGGSAPPGRVTALGAGRAPRAVSPGLPVFLSTHSSSAFSPGPGARGGRALRVVERDCFPCLSIEILSFNRIRCALGPGRGGTSGRGCRAALSARAPRLSAARGRRPGAHTLARPLGSGVSPPRLRRAPGSPDASRCWLGPPLPAGEGREERAPRSWGRIRAGVRESAVGVAQSPRPARPAAKTPERWRPLREDPTRTGVTAPTPTRPLAVRRSPEGPSACSQRTLI